MLVQGFGSRVARSVENFEHVMHLEEMARQRMSKRTVLGEGGLDAGKTQGNYLRDLIISEATDWQVLTLYLAVHMQQLRAAIGSGACDAGQVCAFILVLVLRFAESSRDAVVTGGMTRCFGGRASCPCCSGHGDMLRALKNAVLSNNYTMHRDGVVAFATRAFGEQPRQRNVYCIYRI